MSTEKESPLKIVIGKAIFWIGVAAFAYVLSTGPVTRWAPGFGELLYAPLSPAADNKVLGPALRTWLTLWGVDVGE